MILEDTKAKATASHYRYETPPGVQSLFAHPLVAADSGDAQDLEAVGLQKDKDGLHVASAGTASVVIDNYLEFVHKRYST